MGATASCNFPGLKQWKDIVDKNKFAAFIDAILCGYGQVILSDNSFSGLLVIIATFVSSVQLGAGALWAAFIAVAFQFIMGTPRIPVRIGLYTYAPVLSGAILAGLMFQNGMSIMFFVFIGLASLFACMLSMALSTFLEKWEAPSLGLAFAVTVMTFMSAAQNMGFVPQGEVSVPHAFEAFGGYEMGFWNKETLMTAFQGGVAELMGLAGLPAIIILLTSIAISSRIDLISAIAGMLIATLTAIYFGCPNIPVMLGLYGYNGIFLMMALNGRAFTLSIKSVALNVILLAITTCVTAMLSAAFAPLGCVYTAMPFSLVAIIAILAVPKMTGIQYNKPLYWGVPETVKATREFFESQGQ